MTWNHRVVKRKGKPFHGIPQPDWYAIHEVYYDKKGRPKTLTAEPVAPGGETPDELRDDLNRMRDALKKPILQESDFPQGTFP